MSYTHHLLPILSLLLCISQALSHPVFGTKRYGRATGVPAPHRVPPYAHLPLLPTTVNHYPAPTYYTDSLKYPPYSPDYDVDYYYPPEPTYNYPVPPYYPAPVAPVPSGDDNLKYAIYQSLLPFYYDARRPAYGYYGPEVNPTEGFQDEVQHEEEERDDREDALPVGQETWFDDGGQQVEQPQTEQESMAQANAAFLQNLIASQMYNDAQNRESAAATRRRHLGISEPTVDANNDADFAYDEVAPSRAGNTGYYSDDYEDQDVRELKSLVKKTKGNNEGRLIRVPRRRDGEKIYYGTQMNDAGSWDRASNKRSIQYGKIIDAPMKRKQYSNWTPSSFALQKEVAKPYETDEASSENTSVEEKEISSSTTHSAPETAAPTTPAPDFDARRGQKEVPLLRPATPTRTSLAAEEEEAAEASNASVYETIKQLLSMEEGLRQDTDETLLAQPQKRFVSNEDSLVDQLGKLRKLSA